MKFIISLASFMYSFNMLKRGLTPIFRFLSDEYSHLWRSRVLFQDNFKHNSYAMELEFKTFGEPTNEHYELLLDADPSKEAVSNYLQRSFCFEAKRENNLVGVLILLPTRPETVEIVNIAVSKTCQQQGFGAQLIGFALEWASKNNYKIIEIGTGSTSFGQLYLYQKFGFRIVGVDSDFFLKNYKEPIFENKLRLRDMLRLRKHI